MVKCIVGLRDTVLLLRDDGLRGTAGDPPAGDR
jgi:hypothetical protein